MTMIGAGTPCPDFSLPDDRGETIALSNLKGRPFVLYFYPKDDTSGCTVEANDFSRLGPDFAQAGVAVFGVSPDGVTSHGKFRDKHALTVPLLSDESKALVTAFGVWVEKSMYGKIYMGVERATALVDAEARVARVWPKVKVPGHAAEVLEAARALAGAA